MNQGVFVVCTAIFADDFRPDQTCSNCASTMLISLLRDTMAQEKMLVFSGYYCDYDSSQSGKTLKNAMRGYRGRLWVSLMWIHVAVSCLSPLNSLGTEWLSLILLLRWSVSHGRLKLQLGSRRNLSRFTSLLKGSQSSLIRNDYYWLFHPFST